MNEELIGIVEPQKKLFREIIQEINGKTMDYESCRLLEEFFDEHNKSLLNAFEISLNILKEKIK